MTTFFAATKGTPVIWTSSAAPAATPNSTTAAKIRSFGNLPDGWHYGSGSGSPPWVVRAALDHLYQFMMLGFSETNAFIGGDGQIMVTAYRGDHCVEVTIELDNTLSVAHQFQGADVSFSPEISKSQAYAELARVVGSIDQGKCDTFGLLTSTTLITGQGNFENSLLASQAEAEERLFLMSNAGSLAAAASALTPITSTPGSGEFRQPIGRSTRPYLPRPAA